METPARLEPDGEAPDQPERDARRLTGFNQTLRFLEYPCPGWTSISLLLAWPAIMPRPSLRIAQFSHIIERSAKY